MKLRFVPSPEILAAGAEKMNTRLAIRPNVWLTVYSHYVALHTIAVPAILLYFEQYILAGAAFVSFVTATLIYQWKGGGNNYLNYYRQVLGNAPEPMDLELLDDGIRTSCHDCSSLYSWEGIVDLSEEDTAVYFFLKECAIPVPKSAFGSPSECERFVGFARARMPAE